MIDSWKGLETLNEYICCCWCFLVWFSSASKTCMWQFSMIHGWSIHIRSLGHTSNAFLIGNLYLIAFEHSIRCIVLIALKTRLKVMFNIMYRHIIIITHTHGHWIHLKMRSIRFLCSVAGFCISMHIFKLVCSHSSIKYKKRKQFIPHFIISIKEKWWAFIGTAQCQTHRHT